MNKTQIIACLSTLAILACSGSDVEQRQAEVAERGEAVMPFDLDRSTHFFEKAEYGGIQTVVSDDRDEEQIALIRTHLAQEARRFSRGDFDDPEMIHGADMPGLNALTAGHERMVFTYRPVEDGGTILYESDDPILVDALHQWFDAQVRDHGEHAEVRH